MIRNFLFIISFTLLACGRNDYVPSQVGIVEQDGKWNISIKNYNATTNDDRIHVYLGERDLGQPSILGSTLNHDSLALWKPTFSLKRDTSYTVYSDQNYIGTVHIPALNESRPMVTSIYPSADSLPENLLKFYIHFSEPMSELGTYENIQIKKENGQWIHQPFVELNPPLWNQDHTRLTMWLDPGRIKRGLNPNRELGAVLHATENYTLEVGKGLRNQKGIFLNNSTQKKFYTKTADRTQINHKEWNIVLPPPGTLKPLEIHFGESLDRALALHSIDIIHNQKGKIYAEIRITKNETVLLFQPSESWIKGEYNLSIQATLEDLVGNNLIRLFDRDIKKDPIPAEEIVIFRSFKIID